MFTRRINWDVYLNRKWINTVAFRLEMNSTMVKDSLVKHAGFDSKIVVRKNRDNKKNEKKDK